MSSNLFLIILYVLDLHLNQAKRGNVKSGCPVVKLKEKKAKESENQPARLGRYIRDLGIVKEKGGIGMGSCQGAAGVVCPDCCGGGEHNRVPLRRRRRWKKTNRGRVVVGERSVGTGDTPRGRGTESAARDCT
jgi:hypothetical protein